MNSKFKIQNSKTVSTRTAIAIPKLALNLLKNVKFDDILKQIHGKIASHQYVMTTHAEEEKSEDGLAIYDIERGILTGIILERQRDRVSGEAKYRLRGRTLDEEEVEIIVKLSLTGKVVIITVYAL